MKISIVSCVVLTLFAAACDKSSSTSAAPQPSAASSVNAASAPTTAASPEAKPAASPASAADAFPATALPGKSFADTTINVPPGGKLDKAGEKVSLETPDYKLMIKSAKKNDTADMKGMLSSMPGFKGITVESPDGIVAQVEEKGAPQFVLTRYVKVGDALLSCESALTKPPKDKAKAQEAFDVCGTLKKK